MRRVLVFPTLLLVCMHNAVGLLALNASSSPSGTSSYPWYSVSYDGCFDKRGHSSVYGYDDKHGMEFIFNFSWALWKPNICSDLVLAMGPGIEVHGHIVWTAMYGRTAYESTSLLRIDMDNQTVTQSTWFGGGAHYFNMHFDTKRNVLIVVRHEALTTTVQEYDPVTLQPGRILGEFNQNAPERMDAFYDRSTQVLTQVVEHHLVDNWWMALDCSSAETKATVMSLKPFAGDTQPLGMAFGPSADKGNQLLAVYKGPDFTGRSTPVQVFHVDPKTGTWPASSHGNITIAARTQTSISLQTPLNVKRRQVLTFLGEQYAGMFQKTCRAVLIDFDTLKTRRAASVPCSQAADGAWFSLSQADVTTSKDIIATLV